MGRKAASNWLCILMLFISSHRRTMTGEALTSTSLDAMDICHEGLSVIFELFSAESPCVPLLSTHFPSTHYDCLDCLRRDLRSSTHRCNDRWLSPEGFPASKFSTLISSSRSGQ